MNKSHVYKLSNGEIVKDRPELFKARDEMIWEAKGIEQNLKFTKKLPKEGTLEQFEEIWLNNPYVLKYRELMRKIWAFIPEVQIVEEIPCCEECGKWDVRLFDFIYHTSFTTKRDGKFVEVRYDHAKVLCKDCIKKTRELWSPTLSTDSIKPHQED